MGVLTESDVDYGVVDLDAIYGYVAEIAFEMERRIFWRIGGSYRADGWSYFAASLLGW